MTSDSAMPSSIWTNVDRLQASLKSHLRCKPSDRGPDQPNSFPTPSRCMIDWAATPQVAYVAGPSHGKEHDMYDCVIMFAHKSSQQPKCATLKSSIIIQRLTT